MNENRHAYCRRCQAEILLMKSAKGRLVPCDPELVPYQAGGPERMMTEDGEIVGGYTHYPINEAPDGVGHRFHICPYSDRPRKRERAERRDNGKGKG